MMNVKLAAVAASTATLAAVALSGGAATASGGGGTSGAWPSTSYPLPINPGRVISQTSSSAVLRSSETVATVRDRLDYLYVTQKGCTAKLVVNKPKDYFCKNPATGKTDEIYFTFAALDPKPTDRSQTNAYLVRG